MDKFNKLDIIFSGVFRVFNLILKNLRKEKISKISFNGNNTSYYFWLSTIFFWNNWNIQNIKWTHYLVPEAFKYYLCFNWAFQ